MSSRTDSLTEGRVLELLRGGNQMSPVQIGEALGMDRLPVRAALDRLRRKGVARVAGLGDRARHWGDGGSAGMWEALPTS